MSAVENKLSALLDKHLGISDSAALDSSSVELGINSMDAINFLKVVNSEFGVDIAPEEAAQFASMRDLVNRLDG